MEKSKPASKGLKHAALPRIAKVLGIEGFVVTALWTTMEVRVNDFTREANNWADNSYLAPLADPMVFKRAELSDGGLEWPEALAVVPHFEVLGCSQFQPISFDPDTMYSESSFLVHLDTNKQLSELVKSTRISEKISQQELARRSGVSKQYINRLESGRTDIQFGSLVQILELGLHKRIILTDLDEEYLKKLAAQA